ncbi:MAG: RNA methyltransferase [Actinomycetes bacterium]
MVGARRLLQRKFRAAEGQFLVEGAAAVGEALASDWVVTTLFLTSAAATRHPDLQQAAQAKGAEVIYADSGALDSLSDTKSPQELVAVVDVARSEAAELWATAPRLVVGLVDCNDPGNLGAVIRVADAAGAGAVVLTPDCVDLTNPKVVRATTGSLFHLPVLTQVPWAESIAAARGAGLQVLATTGNAAAEDLDDLIDAGHLAHPTLWLFGSEAHGLPGDALSAADRRVRIPMLGRAESLNLATAAAVCLYASARAQRESTN